MIVVNGINRPTTKPLKYFSLFLSVPAYTSVLSVVVVRVVLVSITYLYYFYFIMPKTKQSAQTV